ncbi:hypothetical protein CACET_c27300 [Clostridium aceticum]|uniref:Uncharacterized protein n=1 Tax=Clostridium aceticum TaxID=84022 RepID=A0A0D8IBJ4_9CLOT|nr:hypothetical protein [Clostridium aceticum]AKL96175.1 hypothetical protein CACET_c27300 [Clostridium aceticum]KJF26596.1 hypothetical protein TZ02_12020 [Clostridium aceticum]
MKSYLDQFTAMTNIHAKWQICQQYHGEQWKIRKTGIGASCESDGGHFWVTDMPLQGYGTISIASENIPNSNVLGFTDICVEPPRSLEDLIDCGCPLFCYEE